MDEEALVRVVAAGDTHIGLREHNEDAVLIRRELDLFAVADGAGGENAGNMASTLAMSALAHYVEQTTDEGNGFDVLGLPLGARRLSRAVHHANREVLQMAKTADRFRGMGTTLVGVLVDRFGAVAHLAHVGDSRCYRLRQGQLELLTQDHSLANDVLELAPDLTDERAKALPPRVITRALGMGKQVRVSMQSLALLPGDRFLLCSDGLTDMLEEEQIADALRQDLRPDATVKLLLEVANAAEARDNVAAVLVECRSAGPVDWPTPLLRQRKGITPDDSDDPEVLVIDEGASSGGASAAQDDDEPEIEISGGSEPPEDGIPLAAAESDDDEDDQPTQEIEIRMIPEGSASKEKVEAVQVLLGRIPAESRPGSERDPTLPFQRRCKKCGALFDGKANMCPNCWE
ncbi:MAG: hypothetical protein CMN30_30900 [Sandaracinus sp.]|nr:hypothetical protein [Sandaracinus sp.]|tara:strand:- start:101 stop:1309 length:1209 start_codon:yes stop_codon:yes gene_type:complete